MLSASRKNPTKMSRAMEETEIIGYINFLRMNERVKSRGQMEMVTDIGCRIFYIPKRRRDYLVSRYRDNT